MFDRTISTTNDIVMDDIALTENRTSPSLLYRKQDIFRRDIETGNPKMILSGRTMTMSDESTDSEELTKKRNMEHASLILGLERTLFAALNNAWLLSIGGIGLMSVGNGDERATLSGILILSLGIVCAILAYIAHFVRVYQMKYGQVYPVYQTILWSSMIACLTVTTLLLELYFGILHPYLERSKAVTLSSEP